MSVMEEILAWGFTELGLHKIWLRVDERTIFSYNRIG